MKKLISIALLCCSFFTHASIVHKDMTATEYFKVFDYTDKNNHKDSFSIETKLVSRSREIIDYLNANPEYTPLRRKHSSKEKLAMILVYTSMLLMNNNNGLIQGELSPELLTELPHTVDKDNTKQEISTRYELAESFLRFARKLLPNNVRIMAWHSSNMLRMQKYNTGKVSEEVLDWIISMTKDYPIFHLFNALTVASDYDFGEKRNKVIFDTVELMNSTDSPCFPPIKFLRKGEAKNCNTTKKTPYAMQGTSVYMGDVYLKEAMKPALSAEDKQKYLKKALGIYRRPKLFKPIRTQFWKLKKNLNNRIKMIKTLQSGHEVDSEFFKTREYLDIYTCKSCHQGGKDRSALKINLP